MKKRSAGFTMTEMIVVIGVILIAVSLLMPLATSIRLKAKKSQCANNLVQIHSALTMYSLDNNRLLESYPIYLTNLFSVDMSNANANGAYINDERVFICPVDDTKATKNAKNITALKPGTPVDDKSDWAERVANGYGQRNCSYLYEFSGRISETCVLDQDGGYWNYDYSQFGDSYLVSGVDHWQEPLPGEIVRQGIPMTTADGDVLGVTWQDMKFFQLKEGDIYISGNGFSPDNFPDPPPGFDDPSDFYWNNDVPEENYVNCYSRTWMPMIRCFWHQTPIHIDNEAYEEVQNISLDGNVFNSAPYWERSAFKYGPKVGG